jgi:hypothetical protein
MRLTLERARVIDEFVQRLLLSFDVGYDTARELTKQFIVAHSGSGRPFDELLFHGDPSNLENLRSKEHDGNAYWAYFPTPHSRLAEGILSDDSAESLCRILDSLPSFVLDAITQHRRTKAIQELRDLCTDYVELRGISDAPVTPAAALKPRRKRDQATESRDRWIYEQCCKLVPYDTISIQLRRKPKSWERIESKQGIRAAAIRYAKANNLPQIPTRQNL